VTTQAAENETFLELLGPTWPQGQSAAVLCFIINGISVLLALQILTLPILHL
jgi:hypothetical protein